MTDLDRRRRVAALERALAGNRERKTAHENLREERNLLVTQEVALEKEAAGLQAKIAALKEEVRESPTQRTHDRLMAPGETRGLPARCTETTKPIQAGRQSGLPRQ